MTGEVAPDDVAVGSGSVTARPPRRTFWQWLRRRPRPYALAS